MGNCQIMSFRRPLDQTRNLWNLLQWKSAGGPFQFLWHNLHGVWLENFVWMHCWAVGWIVTWFPFRMPQQVQLKFFHRWTTLIMKSSWFFYYKKREDWAANQPFLLLLCFLTCGWPAFHLECLWAKVSLLFWGENCLLDSHIDFHLYYWLILYLSCVIYKN